MAVGLGADMKSRQKTQVKFEGMLGRVMGMFGGKAAKEGIISTVAISGDRMMTVTEQTGELVDLAAEKVYEIDFKGKSYTVKTFAEIRKEWEEAQAKMKEQAAEAKEQPEQPQGDVQYEIDFNVDKTGQRKTVNGYDCQQVVMTIAMRQKGKKLEDGGGMVMTTDMWMAPKIPAMQEQAAFMQRYMKKLFGSDTETMARDLAQAMAMYPQMKAAMERMKKESVKLDGTAVLTTMKVETVMSPEQAQAQAESGDQPKVGLGGSPAASAGCSAGRRRPRRPRKKASPPPAGAEEPGHVHDEHDRTARGVRRRPARRTSRFPRASSRSSGAAAGAVSDGAPADVVFLKGGDLREGGAGARRRLRVRVQIERVQEVLVRGRHLAELFELHEPRADVGRRRGGMRRVVAQVAPVDHQRGLPWPLAASQSPSASESSGPQRLPRSARPAARSTPPPLGPCRPVPLAAPTADSGASSTRDLRRVPGLPLTGPPADR